MSTYPVSPVQDFSITDLSFDDLNQLIYTYKERKMWPNLWSLLSYSPALQASHILFGLDQAGWKPTDNLSEYQALKRAWFPCRTIQPPFKKRVSAPVGLGTQSPSGVIYAAPSQTWDRMLTVKQVRPRFNKDEKPSDHHYDLIDIWKMPQGKLETTFRITDLIGTFTTFVVDDNLSTPVTHEFGALKVYHLDPTHPEKTPLDPIVTIELGTSISFDVDFVREMIYLITADGNLTEYKLRTGTQERTLFWDGYCSEEETFSSRILLSLDRVQQRLVVCSSSGDVIVVDQNSLEVVQTFRAHHKAVDEIRISPDGKSLATSLNALTRIWDMERSQITAELVDVDNPLATQDAQGLWYQLLPDHSLFEAISDDHSRVIISDGNAVSQYSLRKGTTTQGKCFEHPDDIRWLNVARCKEPKIDLAIYCNPLKVVIQDLSRKSSNLVVRGVTGIHGVLCPMTRQLAILGAESIWVISLGDIVGFNNLSTKPASAGDFNIKDIEDVVVLISLPEDIHSQGNQGRIVAISDHQIFVGTSNGEVWCRSLERDNTTWEKILTVDDEITALCTSNSPVTSLGIGTVEGRVLVYDLDQKRQVKDLRLAGESITSIGLSPKIPWGVTWTAAVEKEVRLYSSPFTSLVGKSFAGRTQAIEFHPHHPMLVTGDYNTLRFWNIKKQCVLFPLPVKDRPGMSTRQWNISFTPTGYHLFYNVQGNRPYFLDPRSYLLRFVPVRAYTERDLDWLNTLKEDGTDSEWVTFLLELHRHLLKDTLYSHSEETTSISVPVEHDNSTKSLEAPIITGPEQVEVLNQLFSKLYGPIIDFDNNSVPVGRCFR